jgi:AcrR family transcriptional regulator
MTRTAPRQDRSRRTEQALLDAALTLFRARGVDAVTVGDIAAAAGVAPATIYRRFTDKAGLQREVFRAFVQGTTAMVDAIPTDQQAAGLVALMARVAAIVLAFMRANQRYLQSAYALALADDEYADGIRALRASVLQNLRRNVRQYLDDINHPEPELAIEFVLQQALAMLSARMDAGHLEVSAIEERVFFRELLRSLLGYMQVPADVAHIDAALAAQGLGTATPRRTPQRTPLAAGPPVAPPANQPRRGSAS